jgi:hypothetical protein
VKARPSVEKRLRELKLQERRKDKTERRKLRKEGGGLEGDDAALEAGPAGITAPDHVSGELGAAPVKEN